MLVKFENIREMVNLTRVSARRERNRLLLGVIATSLIFVVSITAQSLSVRTKYQNGDFSLVYKNRPAAILTSAEDFTVVQIAAHDLAADVERVTGKRPTNVTDIGRAGRQAVIIGTLGKCHFVDDLVKAKKIDVSGIRNKWETFTIATVKDPFPNIRAALVIAGSDRRGTAYGVYEMSQMIGVSPWYWWADVTPEHKNNLIISPGVKYGHEPSVKYRGIFLNDEDWGLQPWAAKTFEPETGNIGPKTYAKIFELMLRLKANTLWPAMHEVTRPFNSISANRQIADDYAIVMGSSHAEPMLRNNVGEWTANKDSRPWLSLRTTPSAPPLPATVSLRCTRNAPSDGLSLARSASSTPPWEKPSSGRADPRTQRRSCSCPARRRARSCGRRTSAR